MQHVISEENHNKLSVWSVCGSKQEHLPCVYKTIPNWLSLFVWKVTLRFVLPVNCYTM